MSGSFFPILAWDPALDMNFPSPHTTNQALLFDPQALDAAQLFESDPGLLADLVGTLEADALGGVQPSTASGWSFSQDPPRSRPASSRSKSRR